MSFFQKLQHYNLCQAKALDAIKHFLPWLLSKHQSMKSFVNNPWLFLFFKSANCKNKLSTKAKLKNSCEKLMHYLKGPAVGLSSSINWPNHHLLSWNAQWCMQVRQHTLQFIWPIEPVTKKLCNVFLKSTLLFTIQITDHNQPFNMIANLWQLTNLSVKLFINQ